MSYIPEQTLDKSAFGELLVAQVTPKIQVTAQYGAVAKMRAIISGAGASASTSGGEVNVSSGTTAYGLGAYFSKRAIIYKAGQGIDARITSRFTTPQANSALIAGLLSATDSMAFGYQNLVYGVFHQHNGQQTIEHLTLTVGATGAENATVTIDGVGYTVALTLSSIQENAKEIADSLNGEGALALWTFQQVGAEVVARRLLAGVTAGAFAFSSATAVGAFVTHSTGVAITEDFTPQASWNQNTASWIDPSKGNVYRFKLQYLGYGALDYEIEDPDTGKFILVHRIKWANSSTIPSFRNPSFRMGWSASNRGSVSSAVASGASVFAGIEGLDLFTSEARTKDSEKVSISTTATNILTIKTLEVFGPLVNLSPIIPIAISAFTDSTKGALIQVILDTALGGTPLYDYLAESESLAIYDTAGTTVTGGRVILSFLLSGGGNQVIDLEKYNLQVLPGQSITIAGNVISGAASDIGCSLVWDEDI